MRGEAVRITAVRDLDIMSLYLKLWKILDMQFPSHRWLEIAEESEEELRHEIDQIIRDQPSWLYNGSAQEDVQATLQVIGERSDSHEWRSRVEEMKNQFRDRALAAAEQTQVVESESLRELIKNLEELIRPRRELSVIVGSEPMSRNEVTKKVWQYVRDNNLKEPEDEGKINPRINPDAPLQVALDHAGQLYLAQMVKLIAKRLNYREG